MLPLGVCKFQVPHISYSFWWHKSFSWIHFSGDLVDLTVVLTGISLMNSDIEYFLMCVISHSHTSVCTNLFSIFKNWLGCYFITEMQELFIPSGYVICHNMWEGIFFPSLAYFLNSFFWRTKAFNFLKIEFIHM